ncbi:MAG: type II toxin-antitoxin system RelE/ParE family toxin [Candidatus Aminicenantes bacterium]|nr:type II toxin-antitoxin system RelE/ParE family toxin [Candidatus Aminicenantes bacterium]
MSGKKFRVVLAGSAERDLRKLEPALALEFCRDIASHLETAPIPIGKPRIKKLSGFSPPLYRLRSGDFRAYYRIREGDVVVLAIRNRKDSEKFLKRIEEKRRRYGRRAK